MNIELIKKLNILYVEDEIVLRDITSSSIESMVGTIIKASNGQEGLEKFACNKIDLIITDLSMPIMDGITMINEIRKNDAEIPIIITTAFEVQSKELQSLSKIDKCIYIMKPVDIMKLLQSIDESFKL